MSRFRVTASSALLSGTLVFSVGFVLVETGDRGGFVLAIVGAIELLAAWAILKRKERRKS